MVLNRRVPVVLMIMDGVGIAPPSNSNAVFLAKTPFLDSLMSGTLYRQLGAHGKWVGMPSNEDMGNSEVGHNALGSGRIFDQGASLVNKAIRSGILFEGETWKKQIQACKDGATLHFVGLLSDGNVHSHLDHLCLMLAQAHKEGVKTCRIHVLLDGRDVASRSALHYLDKLKHFLIKLGATDYKVASGGGRMLMTMDRYNADWPMVERGWKAHVLGVADTRVRSADQAVKHFYETNFHESDQYIPPFVVVESGKPVGPILDSDAVICFNFRGDRMIELSEAFESVEFKHFDRVRVPSVLFSGMIQYDGDKNIPKKFLVDPPNIDFPFGEYLCSLGIKSYAISETQKYGHVTYFWNGNRSGYIDKSLEKYEEVKSDQSIFDKNPDMKALEITERVLQVLKSGQFDFLRINFPNPDMVGHTGNLEATIQSVTCVDYCVSKIAQLVASLGGVSIVVSDHGNADVMYTESNGVIYPKTSHTCNPVPFAIHDAYYEGAYKMRKGLDSEQGLASVAATICQFLNLPSPTSYAPSLIEVV